MGAPSNIQLMPLLRHLRYDYEKDTQQFISALFVLPKFLSTPQNPPQTQRKSCSFKKKKKSNY